ncbi:efflux transporter outer membrane subunit [Mucilaginibacter sabulilitoris]|uniref:Efflux transporter outer membrane subunit n=1 Tax=Mucilaginibacter sabulilitoris TaxID=1173583 RepID=A0ABZ0TVK3_9SPHI|nr:efflux transporter outer membrane subunit [Mucilaginibacter sabulilitoris]WPU96954.1 efflux transporter outer membrane subunit [Mucilaginibacter sabulilitoris]
MKNIKFYFTVMAALTFYISSCKVSKDIGVSATHVPANYKDTGIDSTSIAKVPWKDFFEEPPLQVLIDSAIVHNNDLLIAVKNMDAASLILGQAKLGNLPTLGIQATANTSRPSDNSLNGLSLSAFNYQSKHIEDYNLSAYLTWEADLWGKIRSQKAAAFATFLKSDQAKRAVQTQLVSQVAKGYYNLILLDKQLHISHENVRLYDSTLSIIKLQFNAGQVSSLAVQQAEAQKMLAEVLVPQFEQAISIQENALSILTGAFPRQIARATVPFRLSENTYIDVGLPAALLSNRPDVKASELEIAEENGKFGYAKANMYPSLSISAQGGLDAIKASNWFNIPASLFGMVTGGLIQPIFAQRKLKTAYEVEKIRREQAVIRFRQTFLVAVGEVSDNITKLNKTSQQLSISENRVEILRTAISNSQQLFKNGLANYLEVLTAQGNLLQGELELASQQNSIRSARIDLYRAVGGGWQ